MIFCEKCFTDKEVIPIIRNTGNKGECSICHSKNVFVYDTEMHDELTSLFDELLSIYTPASLLPSDFPDGETKMIKSILVNEWNIFNKRNETEVYKIIINICPEKYSFTPEVFDQPVGLKELYDEQSLEQYSLLREKTWEQFVEELKKENRFHTHSIKLKLLERFCSYIRKPYKKGDIFYRCRISTEEGFGVDEMGAPPSDKASEGRANAFGISCLYLGDSEDTTIHEVRAGAFDYVTIGKFILKEDIIVVDLKGINQISPFIEGLDFIEHAINKEHLNKINAEMGKTLRRSDSVLDYVPTQYITDFVKSIVETDGKHTYEGIEYKSVMFDGGYNLAVFTPDLFECIETEVYRINDLNYSKRKI